MVLNNLKTFLFKKDYVLKNVPPWFYPKWIFQEKVPELQRYLFFI